MVLKALRMARDRRQHREGQYAALFEPYQGDEVVALDCELTGLDPQKAELVSIAAVKVKGDQVLTSQRFDVKLQKPDSLDADSIKIHHLRGVDLHGGEVVGDALAQLLNFIQNRPILGYYIDLDIAVLNRHLRPRFGFDLPNTTIELSRLYQRKMQQVNPELQPDLHFDQMAKKLGVPLLERHTALGDAITTALMYVRLNKGAIPV